MPLRIFYSLGALLLSQTAIICVTGFAARKSGGAKKKGSPTRGFGAPPPTWQQVAAAYKTRRPPQDSPCPCGFSGDLYSNCCEPFHRGEKVATGPADVLRSRYSAFYYRVIPYIVETTHPTCGDWREDKVEWVKDLNKYGMFDNHEFVGLEITSAEEINESETEGYLSFQVKMKGKEGSDFQGQERLVKERSQFLKNEEGRWTYASGEISTI